jgi:hypothetical protein
MLSARVVPVVPVIRSGIVHGATVSPTTPQECEQSGYGLDE